MTSQIIPVDVFDLVVFGGTGDLARRKLLPALFYRDRDDQLPAESRIIGVSRATLEPRGLRRAGRGRAARARAGRATSSAAQLERFLGRLHHVALDVTGERGWQRARGAARAAPRTRARVLSRHRARPVRPDLRASSPTPGSTRRSARVVLEKPIGRDLASARADQRRGRRGVRRGRDLPHRPLSRQGDGAEPDGAALRQLAVRAAVERAARSITCRSPSPRPSASRAAAATTTAPARCATWCRTTCCSCSAWSRWSRRPASTPTRCATRSSRCCARCSPIAGADVALKTVRGQYRAGAVDGRPVPGYAEEIGAAGQRHRDLRRAQGRDRQLALGRRAVLPAHRQAAAARASRRSSIQFRHVPHSIFGAERRRDRPNRLVMRLQPDEGIKLLADDQGPGPGRHAAARGAAQPVASPRPSGVRYPDAYERLLMDVVRGNPTLFMRRDEVEAAWAWIEPILAAWQERGDRPSPTPPAPGARPPRSR